VRKILIVKMSLLLGTINPFDSNTDNWISYEEKLEQYFLVNDVDDKKKVAALLTLLGDRTY
jgi:hypothetical protein